MKTIIAFLTILVPTFSFGVVHIGQGDSATLATVTASSVSVTGQISMGSPLYLGLGSTPGHNTYRTIYRDVGVDSASFGWDNASGIGFLWSNASFAQLMNLRSDNGQATVTYGLTAGSATISNLTSGRCVEATTGGLLTSAAAACGTGSGGGSGYAVQPATVAFNLAQGVTGSTFAFTGPQQSTVTYGLTVGSFTISGSSAGQIQLGEGADGGVLPPTAGKSNFWSSSSSHSLVFTNNAVASTYTVVGSSTVPTVGHFASWSAQGSLIDGGFSGSPGAPTGSVQYNNAGSFGGSSKFQFNGTSITITSSVTINTTNGNSPLENNIPALFSVFRDEAGPGIALFNVGSVTGMNQLYVPNGSPVVAGNGASIGNVYMGRAAAPNSVAAIASTNNELNLYTGEGITGELSLKTSNTSSSHTIVLMPMETATVRLSSTSTTILSSITLRGTLEISSGVIASGSAGTSGQVLTSGGAGTIPTWATAPGSGDAVLAATQTWTGGNTFMSSTTFIGTTAIPNLGNGGPGGVARFVTISTVIAGNPLSGQGILSSDLPTGVAYLQSTQTWTGLNTFSGPIAFNGSPSISTTIILGGAPGTSGQVFTSGGQGAAASWTTISGGSGGIVSPGTFTWTNTLGISLSTIAVTYGATVGSATVSDLTASQMVRTDSNKKLVSSPTVNASTEFVGTLQAAQMPDLAGDLDGTAGSLSVAVVDDSHAHTGTTLSGIDISGDTNLAVSAPIVLTGDTVSIDPSSATLLGPSIDLSGVEATGTLAAARMPALTGDVTTSAGAVATTAAALQANIKTFTSSITVNGIGGITSAFGVAAATFTASSGIAFTQSYKAAVCQSGTASLGFSAFSSSAPSVSCSISSSTVLGVASYLDISTMSVQDHFTLPTDWTGAVNANVVWNSTATSNNIVWQIRTGCAADGDLTPVTWNAFATVTDTTKAVASQLNTASITSIPVTNCTAGEELFFEFLRNPVDAADTLASIGNLVTLQLITRRTLAL